MKSPLRLADRMKSMQRSTIREILKITKRPEIISFAGGLPAPETFPIEAFRKAMEATFREDGVAALQYDVTEGYLPLKDYLCGWLSRRGLRCTPDRMMFTSGSQQALDLIGKIFLNPGDAVVVENPTYLGAIQAFNAYQPRYLCVPMDDQGIQIPEFERAVRSKRVRFSYTVPTFQNPSGITMSPARRTAYVAAARRRGIPIVEDDPYGYLRFSGEAPRSLYTVARGRGVIYLSTFSKILSPGIRLGFVIAEPEVIHTLVLAKQAADLQPNSLLQRAVYRYARSGELDAHLPAITAAYRQRAQTMLDAMDRHFPPEVTWVQPEGGMFIWVRLPKPLSSIRLFKKAIARKVAYVTGSVFHANGGGDDTLRLNFTNSTTAQIEEGIRRLGRVFKTALKSA